MNNSLSNIPIKLLSDAVILPLIKAITVGKLVPSLLVFGAVLMLVAFFYGSSIFGYVNLFVGVVIIFVMVSYFYFKSIGPLRYTKAQIERNKEIVNAVQASAIQMADLASNLHKLTIMHVGEVTDFIVHYQQIAEDTIPSVQQLAEQLRIPGAHRIGEIVDNQYVLKEKALSASILRITYGTEEVLGKIRLALSQSDLEPLKGYQGQVKELEQKLRELLNKMDNPQPKDQSD